MPLHKHSIEGIDKLPDTLTALNALIKRLQHRCSELEKQIDKNDTQISHARTRLSALENPHACDSC